MQAEIIAIGDEILIGQTVDTNSSYIAEQLNLNGITVKQKRVIADEASAIVDALNTLDVQTKLVFFTGGLGPTKDDITKKTLNDYFGGELVYHQKVYEHIESLFAAFGRKPSIINKGQAYLPSNCTVLYNEVGTAMGMHFVKDKDVHVFSTPGVPYETKHLVGKKIIPWLQENLQEGHVVHKTMVTHGVPESELAEQIEVWENNLPSFLKLAYLPSAGLVKLRLSSYSEFKDKANKAIDKAFEELKPILGDVLIGEESKSMEGIVADLLLKNKASVATAESCTGGYLAHLFTSMPGSSAYFYGSVVSYSNAAKVNLLGVDEKALKDYGAVSIGVVEQMAKGACERLGTNYAIATSGIAGPDGGTLEKPVGTVCVAVATPKGTVSETFAFGKNRERNIRKAALMGLDMLRKELQKI